MIKYLFILLLLTRLFAYSQANYHKGSITNNNNQTLLGYINYHEWNENPKFIEFKNNPDDKENQKFYPATIKSFTINDLEKYYTYSGPVSMNHTRLQDIPIGKDTTSKPDAVFLKQITTGKNITLYSYIDHIKTRFFIQEKQEKPYELLYQQYYDISKINIHRVNTYAGQLSALIIKYKVNINLLTKTEKGTYTVDDIEDVVNGINENKPMKKSYNRYYVGAGLNVTQTNIDDQNFSYNTTKLIVGVDLFNNPNIQSVFFRLETYVGYDKPQFTDYSGGSIIMYSFNQYSIGITPQIIWNVYNTEDFKFYINDGIGLHRSAYSGYSPTIEKAAYSPYIPLQTTPHLNKIWYDFPLQAGMVFNKKIELYFSASLWGASSIFNSDDDSVKSRVYSAGLHYLFK